MIFIDPGAFIARYVQRDEYHAKALVFWDELSHENVPCFTSSLILSETFTLLGRRTTHAFAAGGARQIYSSSILQILRPDANDEVAAIILLEKYADQKVSYCDCVSFAMMRRAGISDVFTFDDDFAIAGFSIRP